MQHLIKYFLLILVCISLSVPVCAAGSETDPIDPITTEINNDYFDIYSDNTHSVKTTNGINKALKYAASNNIPSVKLKTGQYLINAKNGPDTNVWANCINGIKLQSNLHLDLNNSTLTVETNATAGYSLICFYEVNNASVSNGTLVGDRYTHTYKTNPMLLTDEFGYGVDIRSSHNIIVQNLTVKDMTGDAVYISISDEITLAHGGVLPTDIEISNCDLFNCRRQGISIIGGKNINIFNNSIHDINGTAPQSGIDLEGEVDWIIENVNIQENNFYNNVYSMIFHKQSKNCIFENNTVTGNTTTGVERRNGGVQVYFGSNHVIRNNTIINSQIYTFDVRDNSQYYIENTIIEDNNLTNSKLIFESTNKFVARNNTLFNSAMEVVHSEDGHKVPAGGYGGAIYNNTVIDPLDKFNLGACFWSVDSHRVTVYFYNNTMINHGTVIKPYKEGTITVKSTQEQLLTYLDSLNISY